jgi:ABC-type uncharacterized transport system auxiliary subunit
VKKIMRINFKTRVLDIVNYFAVTKLRPFQIVGGLLLVGGLLPMGCSGLHHSPKSTTKYTINYVAKPASFETRLPAVVKVESFHSGPNLTGLNMIYATNRSERNFYLYHQWLSPPPQMVAFALVKDLKASHGFTAVTLPGDPILATHVLAGRVTDFYEKDDKAKWYAVLGISILLIKESKVNFERQILLEKQYDIQVACQEKSAFAFADAMSAAVKSISNQIILDLYQTIADQTNPSVD